MSNNLDGVNLVRDGISLEQARSHLRGRKGMPSTASLRKWIRQGYHSRLREHPEPIYLRAALLGSSYVTTARWCQEFEEARARASIPLPKVKAPSRRRAMAEHRRACASLDRAGVK